MKDESIERLISDWRDSIPEFAKAKANVIYLTEFRKSKKAMLIVEAELQGIKTGQQRESYAYSHKDYIELLEGLKVAVEIHESLRNRMLVAQTRIDVWRSKNANSRKEFGSYGN